MKVAAAAMAFALALPVCATAQSPVPANEEMAETEWITINLESAGSLGVEVLYKVDKLSDVQHLRVSGPLNNADWATMNNMTSIVNLDLSQASATGIPKDNFNGRGSLKTFLMPSGLKSIGERCFYKSGLTEIVIPQTVTSIGDYCFQYCKSLLSAEINSPATIPNSCFDGCETLTKVTLSEGTKTIESNSFYQCKKLSEINLPSTLTKIEDYVFYETTALKEIVFPESLITIGQYCFQGSGLTKAILPEKLSTLGTGAFYKCTNLVEISLPSTIFFYKDIDFWSCRNLAKITCRTATPPNIDGDPFNGANKANVTLCVPDFALVNYKLHDYWLKFTNIQGGVNADTWVVAADLSLTNNRRMDGTPSVDIYTGGRLTVGGTAPMPIDRLTIKEDLRYKYGGKFGQFLNSSPSVTAQSGTLLFYCESNSWCFITMPCNVKMENVKHSANGSFVFRRYDGEARAANGTGGSWKNVEPGETLKAGQAYIYQSDRYGAIMLTLDAEGLQQLLAAGHRSIETKAWASENAANAGWNLIGNPSLTYFDMASTSLTCPITVWDGNNRRYAAYSLIDDDVVLYPTQAFFMQQVGEDAEVTFDAKGRQLTSEVARASKAARVQTAPGGRALFDLVLAAEGEGEGDRTRVVLNEGASFAYEGTCDASKFFADGGNVAELFTIDPEGNRLAINERPEGDGRLSLGVYAPHAGKMTLSTRRADGKVTLHDALAGTQADLSNGKAYTFTADGRGFITDRFSVTLQRDKTTGISSTDGMAPLQAEVDGHTLTVTGAEGLTVTVYSAAGIAVATGNAASPRRFELAPGLYIVKAGNAALKCLVK